MVVCSLGPFPSEPHVHKSETLTVIIPQRRAALSKQEPKPQSTKTTDSSPAVESKLAGAPMKQKVASSPDVEVKSSSSPTTLPADEQPVAEKASNGHSMNKEDLLPVSDDESCDELDDGDFNAANAILYLKDPKMIKQVDSQLKNVDENQWMKFSWKVRMKAAMAKFKQNRRMRYQLFRTIGSTLVEADVDDTYWGVGLSSDDPNIADPSKWRGANVMGEVLMQIRDVLQEDPDYFDEVERAKQHLLGS
ncbi:hypothetical protein TELCIR_09943 [Teladorsagia circumcincta]|uniref:NADAR domain-containing protein n=1 Tax=Teladorsagia circumcincta TaxID=45464 RepID=A0A2G9UDE9_TELCI|nr:hypothetical protein TELCIR_09943 [Teladorsagia circumcincta]